nr:hypothetical protein [Solirubrobacteraceae bacterium]
MARIVAFVPDLLFGSRVLEAVRGAGHEGVLVADAGALARELPRARGLIADLTADASARLELLGALRPPELPVLAFYSHVEADVREAALAAGLELVVPRSRMAREGAALVDRLLASIQ